MVVFTVAWTTFVLRYGGPKEGAAAVGAAPGQEGVYEDDELNEQELLIPQCPNPRVEKPLPSLYEGDNDWCGSDQDNETLQVSAPLLFKENGHR